jgi:cytidylate kinase
MPIITINGPVGCGAIEIGHAVADSLNINYVDRMVFAEAAKLVRSPVGTLIEKEQRVVRFRDRLASFLQTVLERSAISGISDEPFFGRGIEMLPAETYTELAGDSSSAAQKLNDKAFIAATSAVILDLAQAGNVVIIGRGANMILADTPDVIHVGLLAPTKLCVETIIQREHFAASEAESYIEELEQARITFFRKFFKVHPDNANLYHMMLNIGKLPIKTASEIIVHAAGNMGH